MKSRPPPAPPESDFLTLWKMGYAQESFKYVRTICDFITQHQLDRHSPLHHPLCAAIVVFYARPFKKSNVIGSIPATMVPKAHRYLHDQMLMMRDQVAAHTDADAVNHGLGGLPANNVRVIIKDDGTRLLGIYELKFSPEGISQIRDLVKTLITKTTYHLQRRWQKLGRKVPVAPGEYLMDLKTENFRKILKPQETELAHKRP